MKPQQKVIDKIRKLLALSRSSNEHEAALAAAKAQQSLAAHNLQMSDIDITSRSAADHLAIPVGARPPFWTVRLFNGVAKSCDCAVVLNRSQGLLPFVGVGADVEVAVFLYMFLCTTIYKLGEKFREKRVKLSDDKQKRRDAKSSYVLGCVEAVRQKLEESKKQHPTTSNALVPLKDALIKKTLEDIGVSADAQDNAVEEDADAFHKGIADGRKIQIRKGLQAGAEDQKELR